MTDKDKIHDIKVHDIADHTGKVSDAAGRAEDDKDVEIIKVYKRTMDNVYIHQDKKDEIRANLASQASKGRHNRTAIRITRYAAIAAAVCAVLLCIPATRTTVSAAIDYLKQTFHLANGSEVTYEESSEGNSISFSITSDDDNGYTKAEDGRLYFVLGDTKEDITDKCGPDKYFRHEIQNGDGSRSVILIGGTPESHGWAELFFDKNGKYIFNNMNVDDYNDPWLDTALNAEGVDSGNPYLDEQFTSEAYDSSTDETSESQNGSTTDASTNQTSDTSATANDESANQSSDTITSITIGNTDTPDDEASTSATYIQQ